MNSTVLSKVAAVSLTVSFFVTPSAWSQGSLTPPGAPAPTMKTLAQVQPGTPIAFAPVTLTQPGAYYLTTNLAGTVTIAAHHVTLDLMGFSIVSASGNAIGQSGVRSNLVVRGGSLSAPIGTGIDFSAGGANGQIENLRIYACMNHGIAVAGGYRIRNCRVSGAGVAGIGVFGDSDVRKCTLIGNGKGLYLTGTGAYIADNIVKANSDNYDLVAGNHLNLILCEIPETIDWPCSVKLRGSLICAQPASDGITVASGDVSIDLGGHTLLGLGNNSGHGISHAVESLRNLSVSNGKVVNWQGEFKCGVFSLGTGGHISGVQVASNTFGIAAFNGCVVKDCVAANNLSSGFYALGGSVFGSCTSYGNGVYGFYGENGGVFRDCAAYGNSDNGMHVANGCTLSGCVAYGNYGNGFYATQGCKFSVCTGYNNGLDGFFAQHGCLFSDCEGNYNSNNGFDVYNGCTLNGCAAIDNLGDGFNSNAACTIRGCEADLNANGAGISADGSDSRIEGNNLALNFLGVHVKGSANFIARNTASGNTTNWVVAAGNACLVVNATPSGSFSGNSGGVSPGSTDPNANMTY